MALDSTANLLNKFAGKNLRLTLGNAPLPAPLLSMLKSGENGVYMLALNELSQLEFALSELRKANVVVEDMQLIEADLEDVFMSLVGSDNQKEQSVGGQ